MTPILFRSRKIHQAFGLIALASAAAATIQCCTSCTQVKATGYNSFLKKSAWVEATGTGWTYKEAGLDEATGADNLAKRAVAYGGILELGKTTRNATDQTANVTKRLSDNATKEELGAQSVQKAGIEAKTAETAILNPPAQ